MGIFSKATTLDSLLLAALSHSIKDKLDAVIKDEMEEAVTRVQETARNIVVDALASLTVKTEKDLETGETIITMQTRSQ